jgi:hypothetical protein
VPSAIPLGLSKASVGVVHQVKGYSALFKEDGTVVKADPIAK